MFEMALLSLRVRFSMSANRLIYFLRNLPILKRVLPPTLHGEYALKVVFTVFGAIFIASRKIFLHSLVIAIIIAAGAVQHLIVENGGFAGLLDLLGSDNPFVNFSAEGVARFSLLTWFIVTVFSFTRSVTAEVSPLLYKNDDIMINYMGANPAVYAKSRILIDQIAHILLYTPYFLIAFFIARIPIWGVLTTLIFLVAFRLLGETINLAMFRRFQKHFGEGAHANIVGLLVIAAAALLPLFVHIENINLIFANPILALGAAVIGFLSWRYMKNYTLYRKIITQKIRWMTNQMSKHTTTKQGGAIAAEFADAQKWSKNVSAEDLDSSKHSNATGFAYLNAIFFDRHNKYFKKKLVTRCSIMLFLPVLVVGVILIVSLTQGVVFDGGILRDQLGLEVYQLHYLFSYVPVFFYLIYLVSMGRIITASVFSNCDIQMLHYSYYRTRDNIFASFKSRITVILKYNLLITTVMSASVIFIVSLIFGHLDILYSGILFVVLTTIGVLFAFNDLFLYYVIQPYDEAGKAKSTVYTIINSVIVIIAVINLQNRFDFFVYSAVAIGATVVYIGLGLVLLLMFAPKRFKLR